MLFACLIVLGLTTSAFAAIEPYNYKRGDQNGPENWANANNTCGGSNQSPINFNKIMEKVRVNWTRTSWDANSTWTVKNVGSSISFTLARGDAITTSGGGLSAAYTVAQFHFHWGQMADKGSEHTIKGTSYPLEMHVVHYRNDLGSLTAALASGDSNATAVLGIFFEIQDVDNDDLDVVIDDGVAQVQNYNGTASISLSLNEIAGDALYGEWFQYNGSLTTPGCNEVVVWTMFTTPAKIGATQLAKFRSASTGSYGTELYRPVQDQGSRKVHKYVDALTQPNSATTFTLSMLSMLFTAMAMAMAEL